MRIKVEQSLESGGASKNKGEDDGEIELDIQLKPLDGVRGLVNTGGTCWFNASIKMLAKCEALVTLFRDKDSVASKNEDTRSAFVLEMQSLFNGLRDMADVDAINPQELIVSLHPLPITIPRTYFI